MPKQRPAPRGKRELLYPYRVGVSLSAATGERVDRLVRRHGLARGVIVRRATEAGLEAVGDALLRDEQRRGEAE